MLAGDVQIIDDGNILTIVGDAQANQISVTRADNGAFTISGTDTTIGGSSDAFTTTTGRHQYLTIAMYGGNDEVTITNASLAQHISYSGGDGDDRLTTVGADSLYFRGEGGAGNDVFDLNMTTRKSFYLYLGDGNDTVAVESASAGRNFKVFGEAGNDTFVSSSLQVGRKFEINLGNGDDTLLFAGTTTAGKRTNIDLGDGNDLLSFRPDLTDGSINLRSKASIDLGSGNDTADFTVNTGIVRARLNGQAGTDTFNVGSTNIPGFNFEAANSDIQSQLDQVFASLDDLNIDATKFGAADSGDDDETTPSQLTVSTTTLTFTEGDDPVSIDDGLLLTADDAAEVASATVSVSDFQTGADILAFTGTNNITGNFDSTTGVLALTGTGTAAEYQTALRSVLYSNTSDTPTTDDRQIQIAAVIGDETLTGNRTLTVVDTPEEEEGNGEPVITQGRTTVDATTDQLPVILDPAIELTDSDTNTINSLTISIPTGFIAAEDTLTATGQGNVIVNPFNNGTLTLSGTAPLADYQAVLQTLAYENSATNPTTGARTIRYTVSDGTTTTIADLTLNLNAPV